MMPHHVECLSAAEEARLKDEMDLMRATCHTVLFGSKHSTNVHNDTEVLFYECGKRVNVAGVCVVCVDCRRVAWPAQDVSTDSDSGSPVGSRGSRDSSIGKSSTRSTLLIDDDGLEFFDIESYAPQ